MCIRYTTLVMLVLLCGACGSAFVAGDANGTNATSGGSGLAPTAGTSSSGATNAAGATRGGTADEASAGGTGSVAGERPASGGGGLAGSSAGDGVDCVALIAEYAVELEKARACDSGSGLVNQCSPSSTLTAVGCFCPVLVNATSEHTRLAQEKYDSIQTNNCKLQPDCDTTCSQYSSVGCGPSNAGTTFVCTGFATVNTN
jgi:hypothetical protein